jgi:polyribonucleotide nucleotidyltransferase
MEIEAKKRYIHYYNFPAFSVGEIKPSRGPGRREIGHGALAERALLPVLPPQENWAYTMLLVSEVLESHGSSSMASVCGSTLALMDAGVPITKPVAGIAMGLVMENSDNYRILTDIAGIEDEKGDMDFKVAGTRDGITALQMDIKVTGLTRDILKSALDQARAARLSILDAMAAVIAEPRADLSPYAPRIETLRIPVEKIGDLIGPKGKHINEIIEQTGVEIDIEDDGLVSITSTDGEAMKKAKEWVHNMTREIKPGERFEGKVTRLMDFGAFVELVPGIEGMVHISQFRKERVEKISDVANVGDIIPVTVVEIDHMGRINLSHLAAVTGEMPDLQSGRPPRDRNSRGRGGGNRSGFRGPRPPR